MTKYFMVKFSADWADEFQCESLCLFKDYSKEQLETAIESIIDNGLCIGTNEEFEGGELSSNDFKIIELTETNYNDYHSIFGKSFGTGVSYNDFKYYIGK